ncbi:hypothetical protein E3Q22_03369 [Wallemia mellicola]|uniref:GRAM domain-containing protein n=2 Tax=Wallemia mellicola TaxID=1708541 RepID=A0A4T0QU47_9BASI|nr:hypothetical protein WALSEDRAFT_60820 [Wallemia mellicola CBS 633.66]TIB70180.1 hypothetical protein E3Q24_03132 [Wallemia mellicola]EIM20736.1 hypothetical protein WALSEDRAFT_60820 [Wallemia mellicola CBS 633.66]TIB73321.1 hypothetical protein E3Q23_03042 [Wallemia mellicola]TIB76827.1 hypothetical protein E3Q22_03369 [Wallemia mellicola]TIB82836.1 hypothetical protein E3Q21_03256 [Wallemia mellicola]|eukprot:XP_006959267.1 hypothetical protein WALSEDRAFT_60820 [Wallemia mellicola CBS 633.66]
MAALNNSMVNEDGTKPVEFPEEKITLSYDDVQLRLSISSAGKVYDARGSLFLSNKRIVFLSPEHESMRSLSVLLEYVVDGVLAQPLLGANRWEASILPSREPQTNEEPNILANGADLKAWFNNGSTFEFYQGVEEMRERQGNYNNAPQYEPLPQYESQQASNAPSPSYEAESASMDAAITSAQADEEQSRQLQSENPPPYS